MDVVLAKLSCRTLPCVIAGDLNIDLCKCFVNNDVAAYVDNLVSNNFMPVILMPTRITARSETLINHMYYLESTKSKYAVDIKSGNFLEDISDHLPNYILLINSKQQKHIIRPMIRIFSERNQQAFNTKPSKADLSPAYDADVNCSYSNFIKILNDAFEECFPLTRLSRKRMQHKPWITSVAC